VATAVVTGAGRGIGREVALRLAKRGYDVLATDLDTTGAQATADAIGDRAWAMAQDVRDPESHRAVARAAQERGPIEVWVNNAGVLRTEKAWDHSDEDVRVMTEANLLGVFWGCRAAVDAMRERGGHIINMASMSSFGPVPGLAVYGATKHGVLGFTESLQGDLNDSDIPIRAHAVCPDGVDTRMVRDNAEEPEAAIIFSGGKKLLTPDAVADDIVELLDSEVIVLVIPRSRAVLARFAGRYPRVGLKTLGFFKKVGERNREKALQGS
jgi:NAD(P)-dependent dehydrogenase (short-subunit alcohol dehydrogenase family)